MTVINVVLADDHPLIRKGIRNILNKAPDINIVGEASDGNEALYLARQLSPDALILDIDMPGMNGLEVARRLQAAKSPVRVLALSAHDDWQYIKGLLENGAAGYITKEEAPEIIIDAIRGVVRGEHDWVSRRAAKQIATRMQDDETRQIILTPREIEILQLVVAGKTNPEIGKTLEIDEALVKIYLETLFSKLGVTSRAAASLRAVQEGLV